jgi:hypothetical protein
MFKNRAKAMATQAASASLNMFKNRAKAMATQAASASLSVFILPFVDYTLLFLLGKLCSA